MATRRGRKWASKRWAMAKSILGWPAGFFIKYDYMHSVCVPTVYPDVILRCEALDPNAMLRILGHARLSSDRDPSFLSSSTRHLGPVDAAANYAMVAAAKPSKIVEIGSGRSTQVMCQAISDLELQTRVTCIDPAPRLDISGLPVEFKRRTLRVSDVELVGELEANDILYIDSSHILQPGTDVDIELNILLPALKKGVLIHVHDIFLPYSYPAQWRDRNWNEACGLLPWIMSGALEIELPVHFLIRRQEHLLRDALPRNIARSTVLTGGSFWLRKN
jgi:hypothetical protein